MKKHHVCLRTVIGLICALDLCCYSMNTSKKGLFDGINTEHIKKQLQSLTLEQKLGNFLLLQQ